MPPSSSTPSTATPQATCTGRAPPHEPFAESAAREPRPLRVALSFATPFGVANELDPEHRAAIESFAGRLDEMGHDVVRQTPTTASSGRR